MKRYRIAIAVAAIALVGAMAIPAGATTGTQGCSPGYWKNHTDPGDWPTGYTPDSDFYSNVMGRSTPDTPDFITALQGGGGPGIEGARTILARALTAAFLNAASGIDYPLHRTQIREMANAVWDSRSAALKLYEKLDSYNNLGCPLS